MNLINNGNQYKIDEIRSGPSRRIELEIEGKRGEIRELFDGLPNITDLDKLELMDGVNPGTFFEGLILCIKNNACTEQNRISRLANAKKNGIIN